MVVVLAADDQAHLKAIETVSGNAGGLEWRAPAGILFSAAQLPETRSSAKSGSGLHFII